GSRCWAKLTRIGHTNPLFEGVKNSHGSPNVFRPIGAPCADGSLVRPSNPFRSWRSLMFSLKQIGVAAVVALAATSGSAVNVASGKLWHVPEAVTFNAIPANVPGTPADVTFDVNAPFNFSGTSVSVGTWLGSSGAFNIAENTAGTLGSFMDNGVVGTFVQFTGVVTVTNGMTFTVT